MEIALEIKKGDRITFHATARYGTRKLTRIVNGFYGVMPTVRAYGYGDFVVCLSEVSCIERDGRTIWRRDGL